MWPFLFNFTTHPPLPVPDTFWKFSQTYICMNTYIHVQVHIISHHIISYPSMHQCIHLLFFYLYAFHSICLRFIAYIWLYLSPHLCLCLFIICKLGSRLSIAKQLVLKYHDTVDLKTRIKTGNVNFAVSATTPIPYKNLTVQSRCSHRQIFGLPAKCFFLNSKSNF